jgi:hypothetical protein
VVTAALVMDEEQQRRRRRARSWALCIALAAFALLIYGITIVKISLQP